MRSAAGLRLSDTRCGLKGFPGPLAWRLFAGSRSNRWGRDVEVLYLTRRSGASIVEVPVSWSAVGGSSARVGRDALRTLGETPTCCAGARFSRI